MSEGRFGLCCCSESPMIPTTVWAHVAFQGWPGPQAWLHGYWRMEGHGWDEAGQSIPPTENRAHAAEVIYGAMFGGGYGLNKDKYAHTLYQGYQQEATRTESQAGTLSQIITWSWHELTTDKETFGPKSSTRQGVQTVDGTAGPMGEHTILTDLAGVTTETHNGHPTFWEMLELRNCRNPFDDRMVTEIWFSATGFILHQEWQPEDPANGSYSFDYTLALTNGWTAGDAMGMAIALLENIDVTGDKAVETHVNGYSTNIADHPSGVMKKATPGSDWHLRYVFRPDATPPIGKHICIVETGSNAGAMRFYSEDALPYGVEDWGCQWAIAGRFVTELGTGQFGAARNLLLREYVMWTENTVPWWDPSYPNHSPGHFTGYWEGVADIGLPGQIVDIGPAEIVLYGFPLGDAYLTELFPATNPAT